ncbi:hypothetical protein RhiirA1_464772 [Rhizophagus irregularis]|uniref:Uncharacterized protein n=1 Tax=Rhizophagus irregularis TaxID=588596 RepID=A0A2N0RHG0_9GLOM|nr:hypothetical protein RhiirA1_464772 [Rhizophagus irregularis]GET61492.1 hypothetical protein RIR_jg23864.t1 [Rhizophagus irregularis DAOM 181602=DAOM 197198]
MATFNSTSFIPVPMLKYNKHILFMMMPHLFTTSSTCNGQFIVTPPDMHLAPLIRKIKAMAVRGVPEIM